MDLKFEIKCYLQKNEYKPDYLWKVQSYLNGFLVNLPDYSGKMMEEFQIVMADFCKIGYFKPERGTANLPDFRLTEKGYQDLILN